MKLNTVAKFFVAILLPQAIGLFGAQYTVTSVSTWYTTLSLPLLAPPNWIFGPVWTTLYILMGIALFLIWKQERQVDVRMALVMFFAQLSLNATWSMVFFGFQNVYLALLNIALLWGLIAGTIIAFAPLSKKAGLLLLPYFLWVSFAMYLNYMIWILN